MITQPIVLPFHLRGHSLQVAAKAGDPQKIKFVNPNTDNFERNIRHAASLELPCAQPKVHQGKRAVVCGSGPSLKDPEVLARIKERVAEGALVYACKAAIQFLHDESIHVHYGVSMDPGAHIASPKKIFKAPGTVHLTASTSDPELFKYLLEENAFGLAAEVQIFHSACGLPTELKLYKKLFDVPDCMGGGFNVVNRAVSLALFMGCEEISCAGTDCGWREHQEMYVDGPAHRPGVDMNDGGQVELEPDEVAELVDTNQQIKAHVEKTNGSLEGLPQTLLDRHKELSFHVWHTRPDMLASGVSLAKLSNKLGDKMELLGDTLPAHLQHKDTAFLDKCASFGE